MNALSIPTNPAPETVLRSRILLVDDHEIGRLTLARLLQALGFDVTAVENGASAFEALRTLPSFEFVLTDVRLPDFDGREVVLAAKQVTPLPRIGLITGWDLDADEQEELAVDWVFFKPLDIQTIVSQLKQSTRPGKPSTSPHESKPGIDP